MTKQKFIHLIPLLIVLLFAPFSASLDILVTNYFYTPETGFTTSHLIEEIKRVAIIPGWILLASGVVMFLLSFAKDKYRKFRVHGAYLVITFVIGAGVITHLLLKDLWGRPRPKQTVLFGGAQDFRPFYKSNFFEQPEPSKSFPCGHCTMGFYFFSLAVVGRQMNKKNLIVLGYICAVTLGIGLSLIRIVQGGHYFSDTVVTAVIMWYTALAFEYLMYRPQK